MPNWTDYKNHVRETNPEIAKDIDEAEAISKMVPGDGSLAPNFVSFQNCTVLGASVKEEKVATASFI